MPAYSWAQETPERNDPALVNGLGALAALEISGASTFREESIVQALRWSSGYLLASHPRSDLTDYLTFLEDGIRSGYLSGGFRDAEVTASVDGKRGRVVVKVKEGRRWKAGAVRVEGSRALSGSAIVERLTQIWTTKKEDGEEETKGPLWEEIDRRSGEVSVSFRKEIGDALLVLESVPGKLAQSYSSLLREADEARCVEVSPARWLVDAQVLTVAMLLKGWDGPVSPGRRALELIAAQIPRASSPLVEYLEAQVLDPADVAADQRFRIALPEPPGMDPSSTAMARVMGWAASRLTPLFPRGSWPEVLIREAACAIGMSSRYLGDELRRFSGSSRLGPVGALVFAEVLRLARLRAQAQSFARAGLAQLSLEGLGREKDWALAPGCLPRKVLETIGEAASLVPAADMDAIVAEAERSGAEADMAFAGRVRAARSSNDPSLRGWLLVEAFWSAGLAGAVQDRLTALAEGG